MRRAEGEGKERERREGRERYKGGEGKEERGRSK